MQSFAKTDQYCPNCGVQEVWSGGGSDYYHGESYYCTHCNYRCHLDNSGTTTDEAYLKVIEQLRTGVVLPPTTEEEEK